MRDGVESNLRDTVEAVGNVVLQDGPISHDEVDLEHVLKCVPNGFQTGSNLEESYN